MFSGGEPREPVMLGGLTVSADHVAAVSESERLAVRAGRPPGSADVLMALVRAGGAAARLLAERGITTARLEPFAARARPEGRFDLAALETTSREIAGRLGARQISSLHLLLALLRADGPAAEMLRLAGHDPGKVRALVMRSLTGPTRTGGERSATRAGEPVESAPAPLPAAAVAAEDGFELLPVEPPRTPVLHRERELGRLLDLLRAHTARVIAIVGESGSGRTALLSALSAAAAEKPLEPAGLLPAASSPGGLIQELHRRAPAEAPIVLDAGAYLGPDGSDAPAQLVATARGGRRWILTLTPSDLRRIELGAPELAVALEAVALAPLAPEALLELLESGLDALAEATEVSFAPEVCGALLRLASRYPSERAQPGRSLGIAEVAAARAARLGRHQVRKQDVAEVVADAAGVPAAQLLRTDDERFRTLEARLAERVVGHDTARASIADVLRRSHAGFRGRRPLASLLLLGPTGVGKTETARAIAEALFDGEAALVRVDLSEYSEPHAVARLIGSPPGYVGHEEGGQLTEAIRRRPASVVLLDELEKAHREVLLLLLQVLEDGRLTDGRGRSVDFSAAAIVMTSNLGSECYGGKRTPASSTVTAAARGRLPPELWNRIDEVLCYAPLSESELGAVVARVAVESSRRLEAERGISFRIDRSVVDQVLRTERDRTLGARPLRRAFERTVEGHLAAEILAGKIHRGARLELHCVSGDLVISASSS